MARILVVDDEHSVLNFFVQMLEIFGHEVVTASNGQMALKLFPLEPIDLIITDVMMSKKTGLEVIKALRQGNPEVKIIAISGYGPEVLDQARELGADYTFEKPLQTGVLIDTVVELVGKGSGKR